LNFINNKLAATGFCLRILELSHAKKINVRDVKLGMYLQEICGSWMKHPFWKNLSNSLTLAI